MRRWIPAWAAVGMMAAMPLWAAQTTTATSQSGVLNSVTATAGPGGFANSASFGIGASTIIVTPGAAASSAHTSTLNVGQSFGNGSFSGFTNVQSRATGSSTP